MKGMKGMRGMRNSRWEEKKGGNKDTGKFGCEARGKQ
jgi:hypothetical protein